MAEIQAILRDFAEPLIPRFFREGGQYPTEHLKADIVAGLTVAVIQIPQSMALAALAGLPPVYGLYASLPGAIANLWGSSSKLSTGPVAIVSLLTLTSLVPFAAPGSPEYIGLAALLALMVGAIYLVMGLFRLGFVMHLVPQSVIAGFSAAAAAIIVLTQVPSLIGVVSTRHDLALQDFASLVLSLPALSLLTLLIGLGAIALLYFSKKISRAFPGALLVLVSGIVVSLILHLSDHGVAIVGLIPKSLPSFSLPVLSPVLMLSLLPKAAIIALVGFVGAHASAKIAAAKDKEPLDTNQELVGQGLANMVGGFFRGFPISGSFTRTAVNVDAGGKTALSGIVATLVTFVTLLFFTPLFFYLPKSVLAAIVILSAIPLIDVRRLYQIYCISLKDGYVAFFTFAMTFLLKPDDAIFLGLVVALMFLVHQIAWGTRAHEMGVDREWNVLRGIMQDDDRIERFPGVCIVRLSTSLYYVNASRIMHQIDGVLLQHATRERTEPYALVIDISSVHFVDLTALEIFTDYAEKLSKRGVRIALLYVRRGIRATLERVPELPEMTIIHNIQEIKQYLVRDPHHHTLFLGGSHPERLGTRSA